MRSAVYILILVCGLSAQFRESTNGHADPRTKFISSSPAFFDMNRLSVTHTFSTSFSSSASGSVLHNEYTAGFRYRISEPLSLRLDLGMSYVPYSDADHVNDGSSSVYFKSASLDYRPNESFRMRIDVNRVGYEDGILRPGFFQDQFNPGQGE
jgi:hypothetical protein